MSRSPLQAGSGNNYSKEKCKEKRFSSRVANYKVGSVPAANLGTGIFVVYTENLDHDASRIL